MEQRPTHASALQLSEGDEGSNSPPKAYPYQSQASNDLHHKKKAPLISTRGSGKSKIIIDAFLLDTSWPVLLCAGKSGVPNWVIEFQKWAGDEYATKIVILHELKLEERKKYWQRAMQGEQLIIITTYNTLINDAKRGLVPTKWGWFIGDEGHRLRNRKSRSFEIIKQLDCRHCHPLTGTAIRKGPQNLWTLLHLAQPKLFSSYWRFIETFCEQVEGFYGKEIVGPKNEKQLQSLLNQYTVFLPDTVVDPYLPKKQRLHIPYAMSPSQKDLYMNIVEETIHELESGKIMIMADEMVKLIRLRQLMCMPKLIDSTLDDGGALELIIDRLQEEPHAVIFVPFAKAIPRVIERLQHEGFKRVYGLKGGMDTKEVDQICRGFDAEEDSIIVCSIMFAESFSLSTGRVCYFLGSTYEPDVIDQAEDRIRRANSVSRHVTAYHLYCSGTVDELVRAIRDNYRANIRLSIGPLLRRQLDALKGDT